jgi:hypothetical protein
VKSAMKDLPQRPLAQTRGAGTAGASWALALDGCGRPSGYVFCSFASIAARPAAGAAASCARSLSRFSLRCRRRWISVGCRLPLMMKLLQTTFVTVVGGIGRRTLRPATRVAPAPCGSLMRLMRDGPSRRESGSRFRKAVPRLYSIRPAIATMAGTRHKPNLQVGPQLAVVYPEVPMPTPRDVTQDADPAPEPEDSHRALPRRPAPSPQADGTPESLHKAEEPAVPPAHHTAHPAPDPGDEHIGATEDQVSPTTPPAGSAFEDEPKQG